MKFYNAIERILMRGNRERCVGMNVYLDIKRGERGAWISIFAYIVLSICKLALGLYYQSKALQADGWNNFTDIIASLAVLIGLRISQKPPDHNHPYGHLRAETISALLASFIMIAVGIQMILSVGQSLFHDTYQSIPDPLTGWIALGSAMIMYNVYRYNKRLARRIRNQALMAAAYNNRSDAWISLGAAASIFGTQFGLRWLDPFGALIVSILICKTAWGIFRDATHTLTDGFDEAQLQRIYNTIASIEGVRIIKEVRARLHGSLVLVDVVVQVDAQLSVMEGHHICNHIEHRIKGKHGISHVHVHVEPMENSDNEGA